MTMFLRPNLSSGVPVYRQLMEQVTEALETGALRPGDPLPGIRPLAEALVINPNAVAKAYRELEQDHVIKVSQGNVTERTFTTQWAERSRRGSSRDVAIENTRLAAQIAFEAARRGASDRELDSAREVQQRLFPQAYPPVAGLDYAGACRPAL